MQGIYVEGGAIGHGIQLMGSACMRTWTYILMMCDTSICRVTSHDTPEHSNGIII